MRFLSFFLNCFALFLWFLGLYLLTYFRILFYFGELGLFVINFLIFDFSIFFSNFFSFCLVILYFLLVYITELLQYSYAQISKKILLLLRSKHIQHWYLYWFLLSLQNVTKQTNQVIISQVKIQSDSSLRKTKKVCSKLQQR